MRFLASLAILGLGVVACVGDKSVAPAPAGSSSSTSSSSSSGGGTAGIVASFDENSGCTGWENEGVDLKPDTGAYLGAGACQACWDMKTNDYLFINHFVDNVPAVPGEHYSLSVYLRSTTGTKVLEDVTVTLLSVNEGEETLDEQANKPTVNESWKESVTDLPITKPGAKGLKISLQANPPAGGGPGCIVFDEVVLTKK